MVGWVRSEEPLPPDETAVSASRIFAVPLRQSSDEISFARCAAVHGVPAVAPVGDESRAWATLNQ